MPEVVPVVDESAVMIAGCPTNVPASPGSSVGVGPSEISTDVVVMASWKSISAPRRVVNET